MSARRLYRDAARRARGTSSRGLREPRATIRDERGFALVEIMIAVILLAIGFLALAASGAFSLRGVDGSRTQMHSWTAVGQVADSLIGRGWGNVSADSAQIDDVRLAWTVTAESSTLDRVDLAVERESSGRFGTVNDTLHLYLAKP